ncbi:hypothetical protein ACFQRB_18260 [Halobaculum litoreum]|uniref:DUF7344 domain-containing protein n=1 Tax=Halobaculum litoreum TaxID=3031998 RepID=A0ABD5XRW9_9EURY
MTVDTTTADTADAETEHDHDQEETTAEAEPRQLPLDVTFEILKNQRRRHVLDRLREVDGETTIGELAEHIAAIENDCDVQALGAQQRKRVYIGLYQCHLPKMDDAGVVAFNQSRGRVELEPEAEQLFEYLVDGDEEETDDDRAGAETSNLVPFAAATVGIGVLFAATQFLGYYLLATALVFTFLGSVLFLAWREEDTE